MSWITFGFISAYSGLFLITLVIALRAVHYTRVQIDPIEALKLKIQLRLNKVKEVEQTTQELNKLG